MPSIKDRAARFNAAAKAERLEPPQMVQKDKAVRFPDSGKDHTAYCKTDAGEGNTLVCYLDEDWSGEGDEPDTITVTFPYMFGAEDLEDCVPWLKDGDPILVGKIDGQEGWFCKWWINNHIICAKPS